MSSQFEREDRYLVMKRSDIKSALDGEMQSVLQHIAQTVEGERHSLGKPVLECVVVESDWPIYEHVWSMIEALATGKFNAVVPNKGFKTSNPFLLAEVDFLESHLGKDANHLHVVSEISKLKKELEETKEQLDKSLSTYGDNWYDGFIAARNMQRNNRHFSIEDCSDAEILGMSEVAEEKYLSKPNSKRD